MTMVLEQWKKQYLNVKKFKISKIYIWSDSAATKKQILHKKVEFEFLNDLAIAQWPILQKMATN